MIVTKKVTFRQVLNKKKRNEKGKKSHSRKEFAEVALVFDSCKLVGMLVKYMYNAQRSWIMDSRHTYHMYLVKPYSKP